MIKEFKNEIYPRILWIAKNTNKKELLDKFVFLENDGEFTKEDIFIEDELDKCFGAGAAMAGCYPVVEKHGECNYGIICIIYFSDDIEDHHIVHECVHITDYFFDVTGMNGESFKEGNETYAYLCEWCFKCFKEV